MLQNAEGAAGLLDAAGSWEDVAFDVRVRGNSAWCRKQVVGAQPKDAAFTMFESWPSHMCDRLYCQQMAHYHRLWQLPVALII